MAQPSDNLIGAILVVEHGWAAADAARATGREGDSPRVAIHRLAQRIKAGVQGKATPEELAAARARAAELAGSSRPAAPSSPPPPPERPPPPDPTGPEGADDDALTTDAVAYRRAQLLRCRRATDKAIAAQQLGILGRLFELEWDARDRYDVALERQRQLQAEAGVRGLRDPRLLLRQLQRVVGPLAAVAHEELRDLAAAAAKVLHLHLVDPADEAEAEAAAAE